MRLTNREIQVMSLICAGLKDRAIAAMLNLSVRTVQNHLSRIYLKYEVKNRTHAVMSFIDRYGKFIIDTIDGEKDEKSNLALECGKIYSLLK